MTDENVTITALDNGPYLVKGKASITDADNQTYGDREVIALCRCGGSTNKPFCDGAHSRNGFAAAERAVLDSDEGRG